MKYLLTILGFSFYIVGVSQDYLNNFELENVPCPYDSSLIVTKPIDFDIFQTVDGRVNSQKIESCITIFQGQLKLIGVDRQLPIFVRYAAEDKFPLIENTLYNLFHQVPADVLVSGINCEGCSRLFINTSRPSEDGTSEVITENLIEFDGQGPFSFENQICFPTQKPARQYLQDMYFELYLDPMFTADVIDFPYFEFYEYYDFEKIDKESITAFVAQNSSNEYDVNITSDTLLLSSYTIKMEHKRLKTLAI